MQIDKVTVAIRPRQNWEAVDLGFRLIQHDWKIIYPAWLLVTVFFAASLFYLCWELETLWLYVILFWWCKPLYSRIPLFVLSRTVFGERPTTTETLRAIPQLFRVSPLWRLLLLRFSPNRGFDMPVLLLEGLKGKERRERIAVLRRNTSGTVAGLTASIFLMQMLLHFTLLLLLIMFVPQDVNIHPEQILFPFSQTVALSWKLIGVTAFTLSIILLEPYYIGAGFALYLNRRTLLEGWDIEIAFHRMLERLQRSGAIMVRALVPFVLLIPLLAALLTPAMSQAADALPSPRELKEQIDKIMHTDEFKSTETREITQLKKPKKEDDTKADRPPGFLKLLASLGEFFAASFKAILVILLVMLLVWLAINHERWMNWFRGIRPAPKFTAPPTQLFGLDIRPESLPADVAGEALKLWQLGKLRAALSLLYRGALSRLATLDGITLNESYTEGDCLRVVRRHIGQDKGHYFTQLTQAWQMIAYANRSPGDTAGETLCRQYPLHFEGNA